MLELKNYVLECISNNTKSVGVSLNKLHDMILVSIASILQVATDRWEGHSSVRDGDCNCKIAF